MLKKGPVIINDISVPMDTDVSVFNERRDVKVIMGGVVRMPKNPDFTIKGVPLEQGIIFACMAETMLMGLENIHKHFSYGKLEIKKVNKVISIAEKHGFGLGRAKVESSY